MAEIKDELSALHNMAVAEVSKHFGTRKQKLQNRLLNDLESLLPPEEEGEDRGGDRNSAVGIAENPAALQSTVSACDPMAMEYCRGIPLGRLGKPSEVAGAVAYLVSEDGDYITDR